MQMISVSKCCFDKIPLRGTFEPVWPFGTELYARMLYLESKHTQVLMLAFDTLCTSPDETDRFRQAVSAQTGIPVDHIWYHELQAHAAPDSLVIRGENMDRAIERVCRKRVRDDRRSIPLLKEGIVREMDRWLE